MRSRVPTIALAVVLAACSAEHPSSTTGAPTATATAARVAPPAVHIASDLPCAMQHTLATYCWKCHGSPLQDGVHARLVTREDMLAPYTRWSPYDRVVDRVIVRMDEDDGFPMPPIPDPRVPVAERATFAAWVAAGSPASSEACDAGP